MMTADSKMDIAVNDRLNKARQAWNMLNKRFLFNKTIQTK